LSFSLRFMVGLPVLDAGHPEGSGGLIPSGLSTGTYRDGGGIRRSDHEVTKGVPLSPLRATYLAT
jgi:hypothetical protein